MTRYFECDRRAAYCSVASRGPTITFSWQSGGIHQSEDHTRASRPLQLHARSTCLHFSFLPSSTDRPHTSFCRFARRRTNGILLDVAACRPHTTVTSNSATTAPDVADSKSRYLLLPRPVHRRTTPVGATRPSARSSDDRSPGNVTQCACSSRRETQSDVTSFVAPWTKRKNARLFEETSLYLSL